MQTIVIFKGKQSETVYHWENVADASPKQLYCDKNDVIAKAFPKVNQQYIVRYKRLNGSEMIEPYEIVEYYTTCGYWKAENGDFVFKKGKNKGLTLTQYAACFPNNPEEEQHFVKSLTSLYRKSHNKFTKSNIVAIFDRLVNSGLIKYCEIFGYGDNSIFICGSYEGTDITKIPKERYIAIRNRLDYLYMNVVNPITKDKCQKWMKFLDNKFLTK